MRQNKRPGRPSLKKSQFGRLKLGSRQPFPHNLTRQSTGASQPSRVVRTARQPPCHPDGCYWHSHQGASQDINPGRSCTTGETFSTPSEKISAFTSSFTAASSDVCRAPRKGHFYCNLRFLYLNTDLWHKIRESIVIAFSFNCWWSVDQKLTFFFVAKKKNNFVHFLFWFENFALFLQ